MSYPTSRKDHLRITHTDDGGLTIYDQTRNDEHLLNATAAMVYQLADGTRSLDTITAELAACTGAPPEPDLALIALRELDRVGLLDNDADTTPRPTLDRKKFLVKLGLVAGAAALVPFIHTSVLGGTTVANPTHTTAMSIYTECFPPGVPCVP